MYSKTLFATITLGLFACLLATPHAARAQETRTERCEAHGVNVHLLSFEPGTLAYVRIAGDGDTDLDLHIFEPVFNSVGEIVDLKLVASDEGYSDRCYVSWFTRGRTYAVRVSNLGGVYNVYTLETNGRQIGATLRE